MATINIAPADRQHTPFLLATMREYLLANSAYVEHLHPAVMTSLLESVLSFCNTDVVTPADDPDTVLAFINYLVPNTINFVFVRAPFRKKGLLKQLIGHTTIGPGKIKTAFMPTKGLTKALSQKHGYTLLYRPYLPLELQANLTDPKDGP